MAAAAVLLVGLASAWLWPTARQYRVSVAMNRVPPVRIHRVATVRPMSSLRSATFGTRRASLIRELPQEPVAIERQVGSEQTGLTN
jgi:hypothetical protein